MSFSLFWLKKELRRPQTWLLGLLMSLGLTGLALVDLFSSRISQTSEQDARNFLSADFAIQSWSIFDSKLIENVASLVGEENMIWHRSLLASARDENEKVLNINLEAIDSGYPFYGNWKLKYSTETITQLALVNEVFAEVALENIGYKVGDSLKIGSQKFLIRDFVLQDPQSLNFFGTGGYRIWMHRDQLKLSGLDGAGSRIRNRLYLRHPNEEASLFRKRFREKVSDPNLRLRSASQSNAQTQRSNQLLASFLGLTALCATFLGLIGLFMIFVANLKQRLTQILTLRCLGLKDNALIYSLLVPSLISVSLAALLGFSVAFYLEESIRHILEDSFKITLAEMPFPWRTLILTIGAGLLATLPALYFPIKKILSVPINRIFSDGGEGWILSQFMDKYSLGSIGVVAFLLSAFLSHSLVIAALNILAVTLLVIVIYFATQVLQILILKLRPWKDLMGILLIRNITRQKERSLIWFLSLGFSLFFLLLGGILSNSVQSQLSIAEEEGHANLIVMGSSSEDQADLANTLPANSEAIPYLQARIYSLNGEPLQERVLEAEGSLDTEGSSELRLREYFVNLRAQKQLFPGEKIVQGSDLFGPPLPNNVVRASFEKAFANRLGLKINQDIVFEIAGISVNARVVSLRTVDWYQFRPNFFILLEEEDMLGAPLSYIHMLKVEDPEIPAWQNKIVSAWPHLNVLDLRQTRTQILSAVGKLSLAIRGSTFFLLFAAFLVVVAIFLARKKELQQEFTLLRCLGVTPQKLRLYLIRESLLTTTLTWLVALLLALPTAIAITHFGFKTEFHFPTISYLAFSWLLALLLVNTLSLLMNRRILTTPPQILFSEEN
jgi:putative ABC transport system permease protein